MKQKIILLGLLGLVSCGPESSRIESLRQATFDEAKRAHLAEIGQIYDTAPWHKASIEKVAALAAAAPHNAEVFPAVARLMARCGFQTEVLLGVAQAAARSPLEVAEFADLAELAVLKLSGTQAVIDLADRAASISDPAELVTLPSEVAELRAGADCQTVDEAIARVDALLKDLDAAAKR